MWRRPTIPRIAALLCLASVFGCSLGVHLNSSSESLSGAVQPSSSPFPASFYWVAPPAGSKDSLGKILLTTAGGSMTLLSPTLGGAHGGLLYAGAHWNPDGSILTIHYLTGGHMVRVTVQLGSTASGMAVQIDADQPLISSLDMGGWNPSLNATSIPVPYYTGSIWYAPTAGLFLNAWWDWKSTNATRIAGPSVRYLAKTDGTLNLLSERLLIAASPDVDAVFPFPGNPASPHMEQLAGRLVLDIWDAGFQAIERQLAQLGDYGITDCLGIIHNWQHMGYDNGLPEHYPASEVLGGGAALRRAIAQGKANGCLMAVHENYVDYYPNYPGFTSAAVALNSDGTSMNSWFNTGSGMQSFSTKPDWMEVNARTQSPLIHDQYGTTAAYLDVHSAASISSHGDMDARQPGAARLSTWIHANQSLWSYERRTHEAPVLGEGLDHWYNSGLLDGVEAQLGAGNVPLHTDASLPLFVDFDLLRLHPLQVNHGMGYFIRWTTLGSATLNTLQRDAYRMQEIAFGHAPFLNDWGDVEQALVESRLIAPVAKAYGTARAASIRYRVHGAWVSPSTAVREREFTQVQVEYDNGTVVAANSAAEGMEWNGLLIPAYGWAARGSDLLAYTAQCGGSLCDYADTPSSVFANARNQRNSGVAWGFATPSVQKFNATGTRGFTVSIQWDVHLAFPADTHYKVFLHLVDAASGAAHAELPWQADHYPSIATPNWEAERTVIDGPLSCVLPPAVPDGTYSLRVGLFDPASGGRLRLSGKNDGTYRYILGSITLRAGGRSIQFVPNPPDPDDPRMNSSGAVLDFGDLQTDGMVALDREQNEWVMRTVPRDRSFTVLLRSSRFPQPSVIEADGGTSRFLSPVPRGDYWQIPLNGARSYHWPIP